MLAGKWPHCEIGGPLRVERLDLAAGPLAMLDDITFREVIKMSGYVLDSDCEPN